MIRNIGLGLAGAGALAQQMLFDVDGGQRVVMFDRFKGVQQDVVGEGTHFRIPWVQTPHIYDIRTRPRIVPTETGTKDLQQVKLTLRMLARPRVEALPTIHSNLGQDYMERVVPSISNEVLKAVVAQYNAEQLLTMRDRVSQDVKSALTHRAKDFNIELEDVAITHLGFGNEFSAAIERKQVAQQEAERAKFVVMKSEQEKLATIVKAEGEAESAQLISESLKVGPALIELRKLEAAKDIAASLARSRYLMAWLPARACLCFCWPHLGYAT